MCKESEAGNAGVILIIVALCTLLMAIIHTDPRSLIGVLAGLIIYPALRSALKLGKDDDPHTK